jgi:outer membrane murein-binding lipoprotein Lpp
MNKKFVISVLAVAVLFVVAIAGTVSYYSGVVNDRDSKIESMNSQIANLNSEILNLKEQVTNLTTANLVTALGITEVFGDSIPNPNSYNHLYIEGSVNNTGLGTAYNAGLHIVAYDDDILVVNMTVPLLSRASFGTDAGTIAYALKHYGGRDSIQLGNLLTTQTAEIGIQIFHEGIATSWEITPVWTNFP